MQPQQHPTLSTLEMAGKLSRESSKEGGWEKSCSNFLVVSRQ